MNIAVEFTGYFRGKTGCSEAVFELPEGSPLSMLVESIEKEFQEQQLVISSGSGLINGVLLFRRNENGGLERIFDTGDRIINSGERYVISNLMGGG